MSSCPLCNAPSLSEMRFKSGIRTYFYCSHCHLISADPASLPDTQTELARYQKHQNASEDAGYVAFLNRFIQALQPFVKSKHHGLDVGCGPYPLLADMLRHSGYGMEIYDPFFYPVIPLSQVDFITCTETIEHFHHPAMSFDRIVSWLKGDGILAIMTDMWQTWEGMHGWYYLRDITHVSFYHPSTFDFIARRYDLQLIYSDEKRIVVFRKL